MKGDAARIGMQQASHRSLFNALGMTKEEMKKPTVGIINSYNEIAPSHMSPNKIAEAVRLGATMAGGTPVAFPATAMCDGTAIGYIGMKHSLATRGLIADSTECMALVRQFDVLVMVPSCDKNVPGLLMAAVRINVPTAFVSGGPMLAGHVEGHKTSLSSMFEAAGSCAADTMSEEDVKGYENKACPTCGSYPGMYTANSINCLTEVLRVDLKENGTIPVMYSGRIKLAKYTGMQVMEIYRRGIRLGDIMTKDVFMNTLTMGMTLGCSTNSMLHLPVVTYEAGVELNADITDEISARTSNLYYLTPTGPIYVEGLNEAGGIYAVMNEISKKGLLDLGCMTVTGKTVGEDIKDCENRSPDVVHLVEHPYNETGGIATLKGSPVPNPAMVKHSAMAPEMLKHEGPARVFDCEGDAIDATKGGGTMTGNVVVIRYKGPKGGPGVREVLNPASTITGMGLGSSVAPTTDGRFSDASKGASIGHAAPKATVDGPIAPTEGEDITSIDIDNHQLNVLVDPEEMATRKVKWQPRTPQVTTGYLVRYAPLVTPTDEGAVLQVK